SALSARVAPAPPCGDGPSVVVGARSICLRPPGGNMSNVLSGASSSFSPSGHLHVINTITVPAGMEAVAEETRAAYVAYFARQEGFVGSSFFRAESREADGAIRYVNTVVWASRAHFERVVNAGFANANG